MTSDRAPFDFPLEIIDSPFSLLVESTTLVDLRKQPRYDTQIPAEAISESGEKVLGIITNISRSGLRLEGLHQMVNTLLPDSVTFEVHFTIPESPCHSNEVRIKCSTVFTKLTTQNIYQIGVQFVAFEEGSDALVDYLTARATQG